jgi:hypothetical protein
MKDEIELLILESFYFILPPSAFILVMTALILAKGTLTR